jgi:hypothetical protein
MSLERPANRSHVDVLRDRIGHEKGRVVLFLGAGVSFGASRLGRKSLQERDKWSVERVSGDSDEYIEVIVNDDGQPFPTWPRLKSRMRKGLSFAHELDQNSLNEFFMNSDPLDCAQLYFNHVGKANYYDFLRTQFAPDSSADYYVTPSHESLVDLGLPLVFTTNYDNLIERTFVYRGVELTVSATADEFLAHRNPLPKHHLIKMHGTIDRPTTVVLTRDQYACARVERRRIYEHLKLDIEQSTYLFVGFSLTDPNVNILLDDARLETGGQLPPSYTVQGRYDQATDIYYRSMGINVIWLESWDLLPSFLQAINPTKVLPPN